MNAGTGFHSNDARGTTITRDPSMGDRVEPVTPLARATGAELGVRTVALPHLQSTLTLWSLSLDSGWSSRVTRERPRRDGPAIASVWVRQLLHPRPWLIVDGDISWSQAHFNDGSALGRDVPGAVQTVVSAGITLDGRSRFYGSTRLRYFGPPPLIEDNSVRSSATGLVNAEAGMKVRRNVRLSLDLFNVLNAQDSDVDYFYTSRLPGEPLGGVDDIHLHPTLPRTARLTLSVGFEDPPLSRTAGQHSNALSQARVSGLATCARRPSAAGRARQCTSKQSAFGPTTEIQARRLHVSRRHVDTSRSRHVSSFFVNINMKRFTQIRPRSTRRLTASGLSVRVLVAVLLVMRPTPGQAQSVQAPGGAHLANRAAVRLLALPSVRAALEETAAATAQIRVAGRRTCRGSTLSGRSIAPTANNVFGQGMPQSVIPSMSGPVLADASGSNDGDQPSVHCSPGNRPILVCVLRPFVKPGECRAVTRRRRVMRLAVQAAVGAAFLAVAQADQAVVAAEADVERRDVLAKRRVLADNQLRPGADASRHARTPSGLAQGPARYVRGKLPPSHAWSSRACSASPEQPSASTRRTSRQPPRRRSRRPHQ